MNVVEQAVAFLPAASQKIGMIGRRAVVLRLARDGAVRYVFLAPDPAYRAIAFAEQSPRMSYPHADWLGPYLEVVQGTALVCIEKIQHEDVVMLRFDNGMTLAMHYFGKQGNAVLIAADGVVAAVWHPIDKHLVGQPYVRSADARGDESCIREWHAIKLIDIAVKAELEDMRREVVHKLHAARKRLVDRLGKIALDEQEAARASQYRLFGELLKANYHLLKRGKREIIVPNMFGDMEQVTIPLKTEKTAQANIAEYFHKAEKGERAPGAIAARRKLTEEEIAAIDAKCERAAALDDVDALRALLVSAAPKPAQAKRPVDREAERIRRFISSDGFLILAGKNAKDNDYLTMRVANGNDLWLHTHNRPGAHVVVRTNRGKDVPRQTLAEAAQICVHLSKVADGEVEAVMYTQRKHVSKPRNAKPGLVLVAAGKTISVRQNKRVMEQWLRDHDARTIAAAGAPGV